MGIERYQSKRDFGRTPEPAGTQHPPGGRLYVIQKHAATRLHYDLRLEIDGVLKSWAVPKGPSLDPTQRRLAVAVEDHPLEYGGFEGTIPKGEYGGGTVILWDRGSWQCEGDAATAYAAGRLRFELHGEKLRGGWSLTRMADGKNWLLIKRIDAAARALDEYDILQKQPASVASQLTLEELAARASSPPQRAPEPSDLTPALVEPRPTPSALPESIPRAAQAAPFPESVEAQLASLVKSPPLGERWLYEPKYDGYRLIALIRDDRVRLLTRSGIDWTARFPALQQALAAMRLDMAILDGEVVVQTSRGTTDFQALQNVLSGIGSGKLFYYVFDLLYLAGFDLRPAALQERKRLLRQLLEARPDSTDTVRFSGHIEGRGDLVFEQACRLGLEGVIAKERDSVYGGGRSDAWRKVKCLLRQELVVGGYTEPGGSRPVLGSLLLGYYDERGELVYCGRTGTGFDAPTLDWLRTRLFPLERDVSPFVNTPSRAELPSAPHWLSPQTVAEVEFAGWTDDGRVRQAAFKGLREDKEPTEIRREQVLTEGRAGPEAGTAIRPRAGRVQLTNPEKVLYPGQGVTKRDLAAYYDRVAECMLPHIAGRPLALLRCPAGRHHQCFFQKHFEGTTPASVTAATVAEAERTRTYATVDTAAGLTALVQLGSLELHVWNSRIGRLESPDLMIFDLDPGAGVGWQQLVEGAFILRRRLQGLGLACWVKTSGGKGLHVAVPLTEETSWEQLLRFSGALASQLSGRYPALFIAEATLARRKGRIFIDYLRNGRGATTVAPYSTRARPHAPVSMPVSWQQLTRLTAADSFTLATIADFPTEDAWKDLWRQPQSIGGQALAELGL